MRASALFCITVSARDGSTTRVAAHGSAGANGKHFAVVIPGSPERVTARAVGSEVADSAVPLPPQP